MKGLRFRCGFVALIALMVLVAGASAVNAQGDSRPPVRIAGAWARPGEDMSAAYMRLTNGGTEMERLVAVRSEAGMAEIHEMQMEGDIMRMRPVEGIDIPPGETVALQPGGLHIMLMGLPEPLAAGDTLPLTLVFASGQTVEVTAWVSSTPIPFELEPDDLTEQSLAAVDAGIYVGQVANPPIQVQDFAVPSSDATVTRLSDLNGTWRVIFFGYMHCPDFCPLTLADYKRVKALLRDAAEDVTFVYVSVDAIRDTPEAIRRYLANFDPDFVGFSADDETLSRIQPDYGFYYQRRMDSDSLAVYTIDHSTRSYLVDPDGVLRASFAYRTDPRAIADALRWYMDRW